MAGASRPGKVSGQDLYPTAALLHRCWCSSHRSMPHVSLLPGRFLRLGRPYHVASSRSGVRWINRNIERT